MPEFTRDMVREWCKATTGIFHYKHILDGRINIKLNPKAYDKLRADVKALCDEAVIEVIKDRGNGWYRLIQDIPTPINWQGINSRQDSGIILPFDLRKYVWIDPNSSIIVAGSKDSGKTGFLLRTVFLNMDKKKVILLSNMEGGVNQIKRRFEAMGVDMNNPPFVTYPVIDNFHDLVKEPDALYVIDYIDVPETGEFFMIAPAIAKIQVKSQNNVFVIGLQKKTTSDYAYGGEQTIKKASLYVAMNPSRLKIVSAKIAADPKIYPKNMTWTFQYDEEGTNFVNIVQAYEQEDIL